MFDSVENKQQEFLDKIFIMNCFFFSREYYVAYYVV